MNPTEAPDRVAQRFILWIAVAGSLSALAVPVVFLVFHYHLNLDLGTDSWGQFGDYFGGILGTVVALLALIAFLYTIRLQSVELRETRDQITKQTTLNLLEHQRRYAIELLDLMEGPIANALKVETRLLIPGQQIFTDLSPLHLALADAIGARALILQEGKDAYAKWKGQNPQFFEPARLLDSLLEDYGLLLNHIVSIAEELDLQMFAVRYKVERGRRYQTVARQLAELGGRAGVVTINIGRIGQGDL